MFMHQLFFENIHNLFFPQDIIPVLMSYFPSGISVKTIIHYGQILNNGGVFRQYDYGDENFNIYNSKTPPEYEVWKIELPVYMFIGYQDFIAPKEVSAIYISQFLILQLQ